MLFCRYCGEKCHRFKIMRLIAGIIGSIFGRIKRVCSVLILPFVIVTLFCTITYLLSGKEIPSIPWRRNSLNNTQHYLCMSRGGRLGNHMFQYASVFAISKQYNLTLLLRQNTDIAQFFNVPSAKLVSTTAICKTFEKKTEKKCCTFDVNVTLLVRNRNYAIEGYLQSWRYFKSHFKEVKRELTFKSGILKSAQWIVYNLRRTWSTKASYDMTINVTTVGVHIRQGDMVILSKTPVGFDIAPEGYIQRAIDYFLNRFQKILFIVCSDNIEYSKKILGYRNITVEFVKLSPIQDMAVISNCDHVIMTVGSFGWWSGFLSGGMVVYYKYPIRKSSAVRLEHNYEDFFLPSWTGLE